MFDDDYKIASRRIYEFYKLLDRLSKDIALATSVKDIENIKKQGKIALIMFLQSGTVIEDDVGFLTNLHKMGLRIMQLTYNRSNHIGTGCGEKYAETAGLTKFGENVVEEMNRLHIIIDVEHAGHKTMMDVLEISKDPIARSHTNLRSILGKWLDDTTDEQLKALAEKGSVTGIQAKANTLNPNYIKEGATIEHYLDQIDHVVKVTGVDYVGVGLDIGYKREIAPCIVYSKYFPEFGWYGGDKEFGKYYVVKGLMDVALQKVNLVRGLISRGYSDQEIDKILAGNWLRLAKRVWGE